MWQYVAPIEVRADQKVWGWPYLLCSAGGPGQIVMSLCLLMPGSHCLAWGHNGAVTAPGNQLASTQVLWQMPTPLSRTSCFSLHSLRYWNIKQQSCCKELKSAWNVLINNSDTVFLKIQLVPDVLSIERHVLWLLRMFQLSFANVVTSENTSKWCLAIESFWDSDWDKDTSILWRLDFNHALSLPMPAECLN